MKKYEVKPDPGTHFIELDRQAWKDKAPSLKLEKMGKDGSCVVKVKGEDAPALTEHWDEAGYEYLEVR